MKENNYLEALYDFLKKEDPDGKMFSGNIRDTYMPHSDISASTPLDSKESEPAVKENKPTAEIFDKYSSSSGLSAEDVFGGGKFTLNLAVKDEKKSDDYTKSPSFDSLDSYRYSKESVKEEPHFEYAPKSVAFEESFVENETSVKKPSIMDVLEKYISIPTEVKSDDVADTLAPAVTFEEEKEDLSADSLSDSTEGTASFITKNSYEEEKNAVSESQPKGLEWENVESTKSTPVMDFGRDSFILSPSAAKRLKKNAPMPSTRAEDTFEKYVSRSIDPSQIAFREYASPVISREYTEPAPAVAPAPEEKIPSAAITSAWDVIEKELERSESKLTDKSNKDVPSVAPVSEEQTKADPKLIIENELKNGFLFDKNEAIRRIKTEIEDNDAEIMRYNAIIEKSKKSIRDSKKEYAKAKKEYDMRSFDALVSDIVLFLGAFFTVYFLVKLIGDKSSEMFKALFLVTLVFTAIMIPITFYKNRKVSPYKKTMRHAKDIIRDSKTWIEESEREIKDLKEEKRDLKKQTRDYR